MFADFQRKRNAFGIALFLASLLLSSAFIGGIALAFHVYRPAPPPPEPGPLEEEAMMVEFAEEEEPEPLEEEEPPEPLEEPIAAPEAQQVFRPAAARPAIRPPDEIPDERPEESDGPLVESEAIGPTGGDTRGVPGGRGRGTSTMAGTAAAAPPPPPPPPPPPRMEERREVETRQERVTPGRARFGCGEYVTRQMQQEGVFGTVIVQVQVDERGRLTRYDFLRGHQLLQDAARACLRANWQSFTPAPRSDGTPVSWRWRLPISFRARNL
ncbi:MAG: hypothetical protein CMN31_01015 [Sandaracinus sp.]|nr:hypothetical protein [Sandaracinus sp.]